MKPASFFSILLLCLIAGTALAQTHTPRYVSMSSKTNAYYEYLPEGYDANGTATYPLILFMTGIGEFGNGSPEQLAEVLKEGLPELIDKGGFPNSFTVNGQTHRFIVITPQFRLNGARPEPADMDAVLNYIVSHYKVDVNRIYITGLSYGAGLSFAYAGENATYAQRVAGIVPIASPLPLPKATGYDTIYARSRVIAANNVPVWATHNRRDPSDTVAVTIAYVNDINQAPAPTPPAKMTIFNAGGHDAWTRTYNPNTRDSATKLNVYEWMLQYQRNIVQPNQPPQADAGADQTITLPTNTVTLTGAGTDKDGNIAAYSWTKVSGPAAGSITSPDKATTTITGLVQGSFVFRLTVTDDNGATAGDDVNIVVNAAPNVAPEADAGADQTITLPTSSITLTGSGTDNDGTIASYLWTKVSGPAGGTITTPNAKTTTASALQQGSYVFRLTVTDNDGATDFDEVQVTVNAAPNQAPTADAGADITIAVPVNTTTLSGTGTDADGTIASYSWTKVSGPDKGVIATNDKAQTTLNDLVEGSYTFRLTVTDNDGASGTDDVNVTVQAAPVQNKVPQAAAGADQSVTLPIDTVTLTGTGTDEDGSISSYAWIKVSGPEGGTIATPNMATTKVTALQQGSYVFRLTVTDNKGATASDDVIVTVTVVTAIDDDPAVPVFNITIAPNPTTSHFSLKVATPVVRPVRLKVTDALGRVVEEKPGIQPNSRIIIGDTYRPGVYYVEAMQAGKRIVVKLLKL